MEKRTLFRFLESKLPCYENALGVNIYLNVDSSLMVCADYPGTPEDENISLEFFQMVDTYRKLKSLLKISSPEQLESLTPYHLMSLYEKGKIKVICILNIDHEIRFIKNENGLWARSVDGIIHKVEVPLNTAEEYINYTIDYYNNNKLFAYE